MVGENKNMVFEHWLAAYGSRLEELAGAKPNEAVPNEQAVGDAPDPRNAANREQ